MKEPPPFGITYVAGGHRFVLEGKPLSEFEAPAPESSARKRRAKTSARKERVAPDPELQKEAKRAQSKASARKRRAADPKAAKAQNRKDGLWWNYRLTLEQFDEMLASQGGVCLLCHQIPNERVDGRSPWHVDHDHKCCGGAAGQKKSCGTILCGPCNHKVAVLEWDAEWLRRACEYVQPRNLRYLPAPPSE